MEERGMSRRIALLSNVNMNALIRMLKKDAEVYEAEGYGNELGILMNPASSYYAFEPEVTFVVMDLMELLEHELDTETAKSRVENWFGAFESAMKETQVYYLSDAYLWGLELETACALADKVAWERIWDEALKALCERHENVRILPYRRMITLLGEENAFSPKMWYMGRILLSGEAQKRLAALVVEKLKLEYRTPKKVLILDLDNTLWGGLAGEHDNSPIQLSEEHGGLAYKNLQRVILQMQKQGVILAIASKNNPEDAEELLQNHPHMVLRPEHFVEKYINWEPKNEHLVKLAAELNLGLDSFVFWDDNPQERLLVQQTLPEVTVPDFPEKAEDLAPAMTAIYHEYFEKAVLTAEDKVKTEQYVDNAKRTALQKSAVSFEDYLKQLKIVVTPVDASRHAARVEALLNKTNQFNLATIRHTTGEVQELLHNPNKRVFAYGVKDCFGDNGIVAVVVVDVTETPLVEEFVMSCRVMGKNVEYGIMDHVERCLQKEGVAILRGRYIPTAKNKPVENLYTQLGYTELQNTGLPDQKLYDRVLSEQLTRPFVGEIKEEV